MTSHTLISTNGYDLFLRYGVSKARHTSRTFWSILLVCIKKVFCNILIFVSIPLSFNLFSRALVGLPTVAATKGTTVIFIFHTFFSFLDRSNYSWIFSTSLTSTAKYNKVNCLVFLVFFIYENHARSSCGYQMVCLYSKIPKDFTKVILNYHFCLMLTVFWLTMDSIHSINFQISTSFNPIMPSFTLFLSMSRTFTYNVVNCFIIPTTYSAFRLLFVNFPFNYISSNGLFFGRKYQSLCFTLSQPLPSIFIPYLLSLPYKLAMQHFFLLRNCSIFFILILNLYNSSLDWPNQIIIDRSHRNSKRSFQSTISDKNNWESLYFYKKVHQKTLDLLKVTLNLPSPWLNAVLSNWRPKMSSQFVTNIR